MKRSDAEDAAGLRRSRGCSNGAALGQWSGFIVALSLVLAAPCSALAATAMPAQGVRQTPSGQPVPRYVSTRFAVVNARGGPGDDYRLLWVYRVAGLPLQVIAETEEWRRVCDPEGGVGWVHRRTVGETRHVLRLQAKPLPLHVAPDDAARISAVVAGHALASLRECRHGWCRVAVDHTGGWVREQEVWGTLDAPQCGSPVAGVDPAPLARSAVGVRRASGRSG